MIGKGYRFIGQVDVLPDPPLPASDLPVASLPSLRDTLPEAASVTASDVVVFGSPKVAPASTAPWRQPCLRGNRLLFASLLLAIVSVAALALRHLRQPVAPTRGLWAEHQVTTNGIEFPVEVAALSPDGNLMAYAAANGLFLREMKTGQTRELKAPALCVSQIAWLHGQTDVLITGYAPGEIQPEIWTTSTNSEPVLVHRGADGGISSPDGEHLAFITVDGLEIHIANMHGRTLHTGAQPSWRMVPLPRGQTTAIPNHAELLYPAIRLVRLDGSGPETTIHVRQAAQLRGIQGQPAGAGRAWYRSEISFLLTIVAKAPYSPSRIQILFARSPLGV